MLAIENATRRAAASAMVRLCSAREELRRAQDRSAEARATKAEPAALLRVAEAIGEVATREEWLHWIEHGTTIRPWADGEWGLPPEPEDSADERKERQNAAPVERLRDRAALGPGGHKRRPRSSI